MKMTDREKIKLINLALNDYDKKELSDFTFITMVGQLVQEPATVNITKDAIQWAEDIIGQTLKSLLNCGRNVKEC
jgi:hypothetical protein